MFGLRSPPSLHFPSKSKPFSPILPLQNPNSVSLPFVVKKLQPPTRNQFLLHAQNGNGNGTTSENGEEGKVKNGRPRLNLRWADLLLDPDPDNIVAVGLTGLLTWASVQVLWQLLVISAAILLAAVKYTLVAALLVFILITLL